MNLTDTVLTLRWLNVGLALLLGGALGLAASLGMRGFNGTDSTLERLIRCRQPSPPCATCGLTRSVVVALRGDLKRAREFHPAGPMVLGFALLQFGMRVGMMQVTRVRWLALDLVGLVLSGLWVAWVGWGGPFSGV